MTDAHLRLLRDPARRPWVLAGVAIATRAAASLMSVVIHPDSPRYLRMATLIGQSKFGEALAIPPFSHPFYSVLIALAEVFRQNQLFAAYAISAVLGGLSVVPLYLMTRAAWGERVATITALLYAFLPDPVELHGSALPEGPFYFFFLSAMALGWSAIDQKSWERALLAGACAACAWLSRPEGAYLPLLFLFACAWRPTRFAPVAAAIFLAAALVLSFPYLVHIRATTGKWGVSASPFSSGILGLFTGKTKATGFQANESSAEAFSEYRYVYRYGKVLGPIRYILKTCARDLAYVLVPFVLIGLCFLRTPETRWGPASHLLVAGVGYAIPPCLAFVAATPFSYRYILPAMVFFLPVAAVGIVKAAGWVKWKHAVAAFLIVSSIGMTVRFMRPRFADKITLKEGGLAIVRIHGPGKRILGTRQEVEFYARGVGFAIEPGGTLEGLIRQVKELKIDVVALYEGDLRNCPPGTQAYVEKTFALFREIRPPPGGRGDVLRVYVARSP